MQDTNSPLPSIRNIILVTVFVLGIGVVFYHHVEQLSWIDALYFCVITLTTIGYGDIVPTTDPGKLFTVFYVLIGISILASVGNILLKQALIGRHHRKEKRSHDERL